MRKLVVTAVLFVLGCKTVTVGDSGAAEACEDALDCARELCEGAYATYRACLDAEGDCIEEDMERNAVCRDGFHECVDTGGSENECQDEADDCYALIPDVGQCKASRGFSRPCDESLASCYISCGGEVSISLIGTMHDSCMTEGVEGSPCDGAIATCEQSLQ